MKKCKVTKVNLNKFSLVVFSYYYERITNDITVIPQLIITIGYQFNANQFWVGNKNVTLCDGWDFVFTLR